MNRRSYIKYIAGAALFMPFSSCLSKTQTEIPIDHQVCLKAWGSISDKGLAFKYIKHQQGLPNILIYGDSISIGYTPLVQKELENQANVFRIHKNGQSSNEFIKHMNTFQETMFQPSLKQGWNFDWDIIHFNVGLHDLKYVFNGKLDKENGSQVSSIDLYQANLIKIYQFLKTKHPHSKLIFATTTPVPDGDVNGRFKGDSIKYNNAALEILQSYDDVIINDLYSFTLPNLDKWQKKPADVHYNKLGTKRQGEEVARLLKKHLG